MTPEQQREQWLKRMLPALGVLVIYFAIISGFVTDKTKKAAEEYKMLISKGIDASMLPIKQRDQSQLKEELTKLEAEEKSIRDSLGSVNGFLAGKDTQNDTLDKISGIFARNSLQVIEEKRSENVDLASLPNSFAELQKHLTELLPVETPKPAAPTTSTATTTEPATPTPAPAPAKSLKPATVNLQTIHYYGSYNDNYRALNELLTSNIKVLPVSLTMQMPKTDDGSSVSGRLEWNLMLWL